MKAEPSNPKRRTFFSRFAPLILVGVAVATPLLFYGAYRAVRSNTNKVVDWLPKTYVETGDLRWFREHFAGDQFVIVSWDGCRLGGDPRKEGAEPDDPRVEQLARMLAPSIAEDSAGAESDSVADVGETGLHHFKSVTTGRRLLNQLTSEPMNVRYDVAVKRLTGSLIGPDGRQTCVVGTLADEVLDDLHLVLGRSNGGWFRFQRGEGILFKALRACDIDVDTVHLGGPPVDNVAIDQEGERTLVRLAGLAGLVGLLLAWWSLRSVKLTLIVFACGLLSAAASLAAVWLTGQTSDAILLSMPSLVYVLAISGAVHLINYYRDAVEEHGLEGAPERAIAHGWRPALFCSVTTAFGLLSLYASDLTPIRKFGMYSALGVMLMLGVLFVYLPAALQLWPVRRSRKLPACEPAPSTSKAARRYDFWNRFGGWIIRRHVWVTTACVALIAGVGFGVARVRTNIDLMKLFDSQARILQDYEWLETHVGRLVPMEVVLRFDRDALLRNDDTAEDRQRYSLLDRMEIVAAVQQALDARFGASSEDVIGPSMSPVTFVPPLPKQQGGTSAIVRRSVTNSKLLSNYEALRDSGYLGTDSQDGAELWRISIRVAAFKDVDYGRFASELRGVVDPIVGKHVGQAGSFGKLSAVYTGVVPIVYKAQRALLDSLIQSTFWSFITITPLLMYVSRGVRAGAVAMLPNVLPVLVVFGGMGWLGLPVDIGSMMSASIALGVAVDDTIHYLTWFREDLNRTGDRHAAILTAYRRCATPTLQAALISGLGLSVFAFSTFTPTRQFGYLMLTILLAGVVAELVLLPALLAGPLGSAFRPSSNRIASHCASRAGRLESPAAEPCEESPMPKESA